jgi:osmotically-inducible protein OsmY
MKKLITLIALGSVSLLSADHNSQPNGYDSGSFPSCNDDGGYNQGQPNNANYFQQRGESKKQYSPQDYYQRRDNQNYQRNNQNDYQQRDNQSYDSDRQGNYSNSYGSLKDGSQRSDDQEVIKKVGDTLSSGWFSKGFQDVSFEVYKGNVYLRGIVDTHENKNKIEDSIKKIEGVVLVNNQITVKKEVESPYSDSRVQTSENKFPQDYAATNQDRQLNAKIHNKLNGGWFSKGIETIVLRTTNGVVIINGTVDEFEDIQKVNDQLKNVDGIKTVDNQLTVKNS